MDGVWRESGEDINTLAGKPHRRVESSVKDGAVTRKNPEITTYGVMLTRLLARPDVQPPPAPPALCRSDKWLTTNCNIPKRDAEQTRDPQIGVISVFTLAQNLFLKAISVPSPGRTQSFQILQTPGRKILTCQHQNANASAEKVFS